MTNKIPEAHLPYSEQSGEALAPEQGQVFVPTGVWISVSLGTPDLSEKEDELPTSNRAFLAKPARSYSPDGPKLTSWVIYDGWFCSKDDELVFITNNDEELTPNYDDLWMLVPAFENALKEGI